MCKSFNYFKDLYLYNNNKLKGDIFEIIKATLVTANVKSENKLNWTGFSKYSVDGKVLNITKTAVIKLWSNAKFS